MNESINQVEARELYLYATKHPDVLRDMTKPVINILAHHLGHGTYREDRALRAWAHVAEMAARRYAAEYGGPSDHWSTLFPEDTRRVACQLLSDHYAEAIDERAGQRRRKLFRPSALPRYPHGGKS